jgi:hypothetical protein
MKSVQVLQAEIDNLNEVMSPLLKKLQELNRELSKAKSLKYIRDNSITKDMVQSSNEDNVPYFGVITVFVEWLKTNHSHPNTKYAEWNGTIYSRKDLDNGIMPRDACGRYEDLK